MHTLAEVIEYTPAEIAEHILAKAVRYTLARVSPSVVNGVYLSSSLFKPLRL